MSTFSVPVAAPAVAEPDPFKHVNYVHGMVLGVDDFTQEFAHLSGRDRLLARTLLGFGTVCGLYVSVQPGDDGPEVRVAAGMALTPGGQAVRVPAAQCAGLNSWLVANRQQIFAQPMADNSVTIYVKLCYRECYTDAVPIPGEPCRSQEDAMAASRVADDFTLDLSLDPPDQREEAALRDFVHWLRQAEVGDDAGPYPTRDEFAAAISAAAHPLSPPTGDFMNGSPPASLRIPRAQLGDYLRTAFRVWVTELRPDWLGAGQTCYGDEPGERSVMLAALQVPLVHNAITGDWRVDDGRPIIRDNDRRPFLVQLTLLAEWVRCGFCANPKNIYEVAAAGLVKADNGVRPLLGKLAAAATGDSEVTVRFAGYQKPDVTFQYVVKALAVANAAAKGLIVIFDRFLNAPDGFVLRVTDGNKVIAKNDLAGFEFMIEVSRLEC